VYSIYSVFPCYDTPDARGVETVGFQVKVNQKSLPMCGLGTSVSLPVERS